MNPSVTRPTPGQLSTPGLPSAPGVAQTLRSSALGSRLSFALGVWVLAVGAGFGGVESAAGAVAPHPPLNTRAAHDETDGTVGIEWDRSLGALRYEVAASGTVVYSGGWDTGATLMAPQGIQRYAVRACSTLCGDWTDPVSVNVVAVRPTGIRYGGGFSDIVWTPDAYDVPPVRYVPGEIGAARGAYRV